jgi:hypothetical protein
MNDESQYHVTSHCGSEGWGYPVQITGGLALIQMGGRWEVQSLPQGDVQYDIMASRIRVCLKVLSGYAARHTVVHSFEYDNGVTPSPRRTSLNKSKESTQCAFDSAHRHISIFYSPTLPLFANKFNALPANTNPHWSLLSVCLTGILTSPFPPLFSTSHNPSVLTISPALIFS